MISIYEIRSHPEQWQDTSYLRFDGKTEYREKKKYGNRHAIFEIGAVLGFIHVDKHNATDFPIGTIRHFSNYVEENTGIPQDLVTIAILGTSAYAGYKTAKWIKNNI